MITEHHIYHPNGSKTSEGREGVAPAGALPDCVTLFLAVLLILIPDAAFAQSNGLPGTWANRGGSFVFSPDGSVLLTYATGASSSGHWHLAGNSLQITTPTGPMFFTAQLRGNLLTLTDFQSSYVLQRVAATGAASATTSPGAPAGRHLTDAEFVRFIETYETMAPKEVHRHVLALTNSQRLQLDVYSALASDVYLRVCQGGHAAGLAWTIAGSSFTCQDLFRQEQQARAWSLGRSKYSDTQRMQLLNAEKCSSGKITKEVCSLYLDTTKKNNESRHQMMMEFLKPPPCTPTYDEYGAYLGCS